MRWISTGSFVLVSASIGRMRAVVQEDDINTRQLRALGRNPGEADDERDDRQEHVNSEASGQDESTDWGWKVG